MTGNLYTCDGGLQPLHEQGKCYINILIILTLNIMFGLHINIGLYVNVCNLYNYTSNSFPL